MGIKLFQTFLFNVILLDNPHNIYFGPTLCETGLYKVSLLL